eukprot:8827215-Prorocentrum_lima.AAC.1
MADESEQGAKGIFVDDISGCVLDRQNVIEARREELSVVNRFECYKWAIVERQSKLLAELRWE